MKNLIFVIVVIVVGGALVAAGWHFGHERRYIDELYAQSILDKRIGEGEVAALMLHELDSGQIDALRHDLQNELMLAVLSVDLIYDHGDPRSQELARSFFGTIAKYRSENSPSFTGRLSNWSKETMASFEAALRRANNKKDK